MAVDSIVTDTRLIVPQSTTVGVSRTVKSLLQPLASAQSDLGHSSTPIWNILICRKDWSWRKTGKTKKPEEKRVRFKLITNSNSLNLAAPYDNTSTRRSSTLHSTPTKPVQFIWLLSIKFSKSEKVDRNCRQCCVGLTQHSLACPDILQLLLWTVTID